MARTSRWTEQDVVDSVMRVNLTSWKYFHDYVRQEMLEFDHYVWRGQRESTWGLESSLDRLLRSRPRSQHQRLAAEHAQRFKLAVRGRRGSNPARLETEDEWWALGQHHGLATPLLDWTASPFVALYFAFEDPQRPASGERAVWALTGLRKKNEEIIANHKGPEPAPILDVIRPLQDENARLVSQAGLFSRVPIGDTVESWVKKNRAGESRYAALLKIIIPDTGRIECLQTLTKMNINHLSLFPDIAGAGHYCNKAMQIPRY